MGTRSPTTQQLVARVREACTDPRYAVLEDLWSRHRRLELVERVPVCLDMQDSMWGRFLGYDLQELGPDRIPELVRFQLEQKLYRHELIRDDTVLSPELHTRGYRVPEVSRSAFGATVVRIPASEGWRAEPVVREESDLGGLPRPRPSYDPEAARRRAELFREELGGELPVETPVPGPMTRGPLDTAVQLRGWEQLMLDFHDRPGFVHELMRFITECRLDYEKERAALLGLDLSQTEGGLWEDDVNCDVISPAVYEEFVHPYECEMAKPYGGVTYHSCGKLTPVLDLVTAIPGLRKLYFSDPWTDLERAVEAVGKEKIIRVDMNPATCIGVPEEQLRRRMRWIAEAGRDSVLQVHMASARTGTPEDVLLWVRVGQEILGRARERERIE